MKPLNIAPLVDFEVEVNGDDFDTAYAIALREASLFYNNTSFKTVGVVAKMDEDGDGYRLNVDFEGKPTAMSPKLADVVELAAPVVDELTGICPETDQICQQGCRTVCRGATAQPLECGDEVEVVGTTWRSLHDEVLDHAAPQFALDGCSRPQVGTRRTITRAEVDPQGNIAVDGWLLLPENVRRVR